MEVDRPEQVDISELNFVDDEDLQASLARARRAATKKSIKKLTPEQIAKNRTLPIFMAHEFRLIFSRPRLLLVLIPGVTCLSSSCGEQSHGDGTG